MSDPNSDNYCRECGRETEVVLDRSNGDTVCSECGLILEERYIDETSEWRTFADDSSGSNDPVRVGGPVNPLLSDSGLSTVIVKSRGARSDHNKWFQFGKSQNQVAGSTDRALIEAFVKIDNLADRLGLVNTVKDRAKEMYKRLTEKSMIRNKNQDPILAACLHIACKQESIPRTLKEMATAASGLTMKDVSRASKYIEKHLGGEDWGVTMEPVGSVHAVDFVKRFCSTLGLNPSTVKTIHQVVDRCDEMDLRRSPISIVAAAIYMITSVSDEKPIRDIAVATGVTPNTIRCVAKQIEAKLPPK